MIANGVGEHKVVDGKGAGGQINVLSASRLQRRCLTDNVTECVS